MSTTISPILSTHRMLKVFGVLTLSSFAAAYYFYATWFISVWCFFAALLSAVVYLHVARVEPPLGHEPIAVNALASFVSLLVVPARQRRPRD